MNGARSLDPRFDYPQDLLLRCPPTPHLCPLTDGRVLAFDRYGPSEGPTVLWCHGTPSGRLEAVLWSDWAERVGIQVVAADRPGVGQSSPSPAHSLAERAHDLLQLADHLGLDRFSVVGGSGGGPHALALAHFAPYRVERCVALACAGPFELADVRPGWADQWTRWALQRPGWVETGLNGVGWLARWNLPVPRNRPVLSVFRRTVREAFAAGAAGPTHDLELLHRPWGFDLREIRVPVVLVGGDRDPFIPLPYLEAMAPRIPDCSLERAPGDGHFETIFDRERLARHLRQTYPPRS